MTQQPTLTDYGLVLMRDRTSMEVTLYLYPSGRQFLPGLH